MRSKKASMGMTSVFVAIVVTVLMTGTRADAQASIVNDFTGPNGSSPQGGVSFDKSGNIYGTTIEGGTYGYGTVFELSPQSGGGWSEQVIHSFNTGSDGNGPRGSRLTVDAFGNLYGTTTFGGSKQVGVAYVLVHSGSSWQEKIVHTFGRVGGDGYYPEGTLTLDVSGNLYGVTSNGGAYGYGTVYEIIVGNNGTWTEKILYSFNNNGHDGTSPFSALIFDGAGNLYGTTTQGGLYNGGTVYELMPQSGGGWTEKVLYSFHQRPGAYDPIAGVVMDAAGNLYGTTYHGGLYEYGTVYRLSPRSAGGWQETILYSFTANDVGISGPSFSLTFDAAGNLYGTTNEGGANFAGSIFVLTPTSGGAWSESTFYSFTDTNGTPAFPSSSLTLGPDGRFYGTTQGGGSISLGTVYVITP